MLFDKFKTQTKVVKVKSLDNEEITIRELTVRESDDFYKKILGEPKEDGSITFNHKMLFSLKVEKVSIAMVNPKMTVEELNELSESAVEVINEIADAIDGFNSEGKKKK